MERLLCLVGGMNTGGAETFLMKIYRSLPLDKYQMDFCVTTDKKGFYDDEIIKMGGKIIHIPKKTKNPFSSFYNIVKVVKEGNYKNVIRISQHSLSAIDLLAARLGGANNLIFRSSNSNSCGNKFNSIMHIIFKPIASIIPNKKVAPSDVAAMHMFGKKNFEKGKITLLNNGLPLDNFKFNNDIRNQMREELKLQNEFVIGHVGRFSEQKNHRFLIEIFVAYLEKNANAKLILIGEGPLRNEIEDFVERKKITDKVLFLGVREDVKKLYQCMDCFVFPSLYEGMPNTVIEAQTSGLNCIISDKITSDVKLNSKVHFCSLDSIDKWCELIQPSRDREEDYIVIKSKGYDIEDVSKKFIDICYKKN